MARLYVFLEGPDDKRFFEGVLQKKFEEKGYDVQIITYAETSAKTVNDKLRTFKSLVSKGLAEYIFMVDADQLCVTKRKDKKIKTYGECELQKIQVVVEEIESWYLAGLDSATCQELNIKKKSQNLNHLSKEQFNALIPTKFSNDRINFLREILKYFSLATAVTQNDSFQYFVDKHQLIAQQG